jgi:hypothetical protein
MMVESQPWAWTQAVKVDPVIFYAAAGSALLNRGDRDDALACLVYMAIVENPGLVANCCLAGG